MSLPYRVERDPMPAGSAEQTYRVVVKLPGPNSWGRVQTGLDKEAAERLCEQLLRNEQRRVGQQLVFRSRRR